MSFWLALLGKCRVRNSYLVTVQLTTFVKLLTDLNYLHMYPMVQLAELRPEAEGPVGRGLNMLGVVLLSYLIHF